MFALSPQCGDTSGASLGVRSIALLHGHLSVFGQWNKARYKKEKRNGNLNKTHFLYFGVLSRFLGPSLVMIRIYLQNDVYLHLYFVEYQ